MKTQALQLGLDTIQVTENIVGSCFAVGDILYRPWIATSDGKRIAESSFAYGDRRVAEAHGYWAAGVAVMMSGLFALVEVALNRRALEQVAFHHTVSV